MQKNPQIFISYARQDETTAKRLFKKLSRAGCQPWKDSESIPLGERWELEIQKALRSSDFVVVLLSSTSVRNRGYFQDEITESLFEGRRRRKRFILPIRIDNCQVPKRLKGIHHLDLIKQSHWSRLLLSLRNEIGWPIPEESTIELPSNLTTRPFAYTGPRWLKSQRRRLSEVAKAAFVLLLFEQTGTGCWGKSYLPHLLPVGLPDARGAITGTPFALLAISSYTAGKKSETLTSGRTELLVHESTDHAVFKTLEDLLQPDGSYVKKYEPSYTGRAPVPERPRHEAGACLIRMLYGEIEERDLRTIERLCKPRKEFETYDFAVVCRLFFQVHYIDSIPLTLKERVARRREKLLRTLVNQIQSTKSANIAGGKTDMEEATNQWSIAWYVLPLLTLPSIPSDVRAILIKRVRQFFSDRSKASPTEASLLPTQVLDSFNGNGKSAFGSGLALVSWRILEKIEPKDKMRSKQAQKMVDRIIDSAADAIGAPMFNPSPERPEGYLGWGAICLGAASVGIRISYNDCKAAVALSKQLNEEPVRNRSEKQLESAYIGIINKRRLLGKELAGHVARAAARLSFIYEPVKKAPAPGRK